ncbi:hypothetical protein L0128_14165 [candidate division KSB1 bacterium]|nr:hypothetical protein [candidate division KSB1 bacterium]
MKTLTSQEVEIRSISLPKSLIKETQRLIPKVNYDRLIAFLLEKYVRELKKKELEQKYQHYYSGLTIRDQADEMELLEDFSFSEQELEFLCQSH